MQSFTHEPIISYPWPKSLITFSLLRNKKMENPKFGEFDPLKAYPIWEKILPTNGTYISYETSLNGKIILKTRYNTLKLLIGRL